MTFTTGQQIECKNKSLSTKNIIMEKVTNQTIGDLTFLFGDLVQFARHVVDEGITDRFSITTEFVVDYLNNQGTVKVVPEPIIPMELGHSFNWAGASNEFKELMQKIHSIHRKYSAEDVSGSWSRNAVANILVEYKIALGASDVWTQVPVSEVNRLEYATIHVVLLDGRLPMIAQWVPCEGSKRDAKTKIGNGIGIWESIGPNRHNIEENKKCITHFLEKK